MAFKALFIAHAPDADPKIHTATIGTKELYKLFVVIVKNQTEAVEIARRFVADEKINAVLLCPGFTHNDVAEIAKCVGDEVCVAVARSDSKGNRIVNEIMKKEGWFKSD